MKVPYRWLKDYVDVEDIEIRELADKLIMTGNAVENILYPREDCVNVVVGRIVKLEKHPDADKLQICQIDIGAEEPVQIVTGATNVFEGALVPAALHNSFLPNGVHIKKGKLRGVPSNGMLCSGEELCLKEADYPGAEVYGILILNEEDAKVGQDIREVFMWDDTVLDFEVGANRSDCLSVLGVARETAASVNRGIKLPEPKYSENSESVNDYVSVEVLNKEVCSRYIAKAVKNVKIEKSPKWMRERLVAAGIRPINNIVDITNFVMLEIGQPMHAYDSRDIAGSHIIVRNAEAGETIKTLDGKDYSLSANNLLICDNNGPIGVAGIMGGENSEIKNDTTTVIFEAAKFGYGNVRKTARELGIATEASMRFSKGLDATLAKYAMDRACELVEMLGAGEVVGGEIDVLSEDLSEKTVKATKSYINGRLGTDISLDEMVSALNRVFIKTEVCGEEISCTIPRYRIDIDGKADISEEVARIYGYDNIEENQGAIHFMKDQVTDPDSKKDIFRSYLTNHGYFETVTYSFMGMQDLDKLGIAEDSSLRTAVKIINPLGDDKGYMRTTLVPAMLKVVETNLNFKNDALKLFEISRVFNPVKGEKLPVERTQVIMAMSEAAGDFYALKGDIENTLKLAYGSEPKFAKGGSSYYHPGRKAVIYMNGNPVGEMGEIHPLIADKFGISKRVTVAVIDITEIESVGENRRYEPIAKYPAIERDIALVAAEEVEVGMLTECIYRNGGKYLEDVKLFDIFRSAAIGEGKKSIAFSLTFRSKTETLSDEEIEKGMSSILEALKSSFNAELRQ